MKTLITFIKIILLTLLFINTIGTTYAIFLTNNIPDPYKTSLSQYCLPSLEICGQEYVAPPQQNSPVLTLAQSYGKDYTTYTQIGSMQFATPQHTAGPELVGLTLTNPTGSSTLLGTIYYLPTQGYNTNFPFNITGEINGKFGENSSIISLIMLPEGESVPCPNSSANVKKIFAVFYSVYSNLCEVQ